MEHCPWPHCRRAKARGEGGRLAIGHGTNAEKWGLGSAQSQISNTARGSAGGEGANQRGGSK